MNSSFKLLSVSAAILLSGTVQAKQVDVYFGTQGRSTAKGIYRAKFNTDKGKLTQIELAAEVESPGFLAFHPERHTLYAAASANGEPGVAAYRIAKDGSLQLINAVAGGDGGSAHLCVHPSGNFLITAQYRGGSTAVFPIAKDGRVGERSQLIKHEGGSGVVGRRQNSPHPHWTGFSPDGRFAFVPDLGTDEIVIYKVDAEKGLLTKSGVAEGIPGGGPRHMRFSTNGRFIYLLNELTLSVTTFQYDARTGTTKQLATVPTLSEEVKAKETFNSASEILVHPNGRFVYNGNRGNDSVTVFRTNASGSELSVVEVEPIRGAWPRNINLDAEGNWLLAAGAHSNTISVFKVDPETGELAYQKSQIYPVPEPICILLND